VALLFFLSEVGQMDWEPRDPTPNFLFTLKANFITKISDGDLWLLPLPRVLLSRKSSRGQVVHLDLL